MRLLILFLLFSVSVSSQTLLNNLQIKVGDEIVNYDMKKCYKKGKIITTPKGVKMKVVIWPSYAPWGKEYSLIIRSFDGKYSTSQQFGSMELGLSINLNK